MLKPTLKGGKPGCNLGGAEREIRPSPGQERLEGSNWADVIGVGLAVIDGVVSLRISVHHI